MKAGRPSELEPRRLLDDDASPGALREALQALRERAPSEASAARIRERLHSPEPAGHGGVFMRAAPFAVLGLMGLIAVVAWPDAAQRAPAARPLDTAPAGRAGAPEPPLERASGPVLERRAERSTEPVAASSELGAALREPEDALAVAPPAQPPAARVAAESARGVRRVKPPPEEASATASQQRDPVPETATGVELHAQPAAVYDAERVLADPQDEAGLLYRARRLSSSEPNAALRLLVLHEASFPAGAFAEERDMLEIQIHERLGHTATVQRLAALFKQRYPRSVYRVSPR